LGIMEIVNQEAAAILTQPWVQALLTQPLLARLGTCNPRNNQPHVTPVWFAWDGEALLISAFVSTRKVREVMRNSRISVLIDTGNPGEATQGVLFEGAVEIIADSPRVQSLAAQIYLRYAGPDGLTADMRSWISDPENRILRLAPEKVYAWR
jgi:PPOX class probable F420-dependent enzyme